MPVNNNLLDRYYAAIEDLERAGWPMRKRIGAAMDPANLPPDPQAAVEAPYPPRVADAPPAPIPYPRPAGADGGPVSPPPSTVGGTPMADPGSGLFGYLQAMREKPFSTFGTNPGQIGAESIGSQGVPNFTASATGGMPTLSGWGGNTGAPGNNMAGQLGLGMLAASQPKMLPQQQAPQAQIHTPQGNIGLPTMGGGMGDPRLMGILAQRGMMGGGGYG